MRHEDRERYTLQCLTASHHETRGQREVHITVSHSTTPWDTRTKRGTHYSASQHHTMRHEDRERYTLQCLTAPHHETRRQREVHITVSHPTDKGTHYRVSQHYIVGPDDRKRYKLQCLIAPHSHDLTTERGTHHSVSQHHIARPDDGESYTLQCLTAPHRTTWGQIFFDVSPSKDKQEQKTGVCKSSMPCSFLQLLHWEYVFRGFVCLCAA